MAHLITDYSNAAFLVQLSVHEIMGVEVLALNGEEPLAGSEGPSVGGDGPRRTPFHNHAADSFRYLGGSPLGEGGGAGSARSDSESWTSRSRNPGMAFVNWDWTRDCHHHLLHSFTIPTKKLRKQRHAH